MRMVRRPVVALTGAAALLASGMVAASPASGATDQQGGAPAPARTAARPAAHERDTYDVNTTSSARAVLQDRAADLATRPTKARQGLRAGLGAQGVLDVDPLTSTPRQVARLDGFLTAPSKSSAADVALGYVRAQRAALGLSADALAALSLRRDYVDVLGTHHLSWAQLVAGVPVFGRGLQANVTKDGRLVSVLGAPLASVGGVGLHVSTSAPQARAAVARSIGRTAPADAATTRAGATRSTVFAGGDRASLVLYATTGGVRTGWQVQTRLGSTLFLAVVDAQTDRLLYRRSLTQSDRAYVWENYPGAPSGGTQRSVDLRAKGWLAKDTNVLFGPNARVFTDVNDDNVANPGEDVDYGRSGPAYRFAWFPPTQTPCTKAYPCSWDPSTPYSWVKNRSQDATQMFYFVNRFHDHLAARPIGFTRAAGAFENEDLLQGQALDGADTARGLPDGGHVDNANMSTPPDGQSPQMQMYLFHAPGAKYPTDDPFIAANSGDEADIVYHEYTHGLSNRLVVDPLGNSTLGFVQAGAMGEAWSDWYGLDYLVANGYEKDTRAIGDVREGKYVLRGDTIRTEPIDCPVGAKVAVCPGTPGTGRGGYTYGDFGKILGVPEPHADGEIWAQTLWDLRHALGSSVSELLVTRAMELSPSNPSFLDERNAIVQADLVAFKGRHVGAIWKVFAHRGMGWFAAAVDGDDTQPIEDFSVPPSARTPRAEIRGHVRDADTGAPVRGALVYVAGHASGLSTDLAAATAADGSYRLRHVPVGTYPKVIVDRRGYDKRVFRVKVVAPATQLDLRLRRDWAAAPGGAQVVDVVGDLPLADEVGCGPVAAIDQRQGTSWVTLSAEDPDHGNWTLTPKSVTVKLPAAVDVTAAAVDPGNPCVGEPTTGLKGYRFEVSTDGRTFTVASAGEFTTGQQGRLVPLTVPAGTTRVRYLRFTMLSPQVPGDFTTTCRDPQTQVLGCYYMGVAEVALYGRASR